MALGRSVPSNSTDVSVFVWRKCGGNGISIDGIVPLLINIALCAASLHPVHARELKTEVIIVMSETEKADVSSEAIPSAFQYTSILSGDYCTQGGDQQADQQYTVSPGW